MMHLPLWQAQKEYTANPKRAAPVPSSNSGEDAPKHAPNNNQGRGKQRQLEHSYTAAKRAATIGSSTTERRRQPIGIHSREEAAANRYPQQIKR
jgi:hypothetical protein